MSAITFYGRHWESEARKGSSGRSHSKEKKKKKEIQGVSTARTSSFCLDPTVEHLHHRLCIQWCRHERPHSFRSLSVNMNFGGGGVVQESQGRGRSGFGYAGRGLSHACWHGALKSRWPVVMNALSVGPPRTVGSRLATSVLVTSPRPVAVWEVTLSDEQAGKRQGWAGCMYAQHDNGRPHITGQAVDTQMCAVFRQA